MLYILSKLLTFRCTGAIDQCMAACLHILQSITSQQRNQLARHTIILWSEEIASVIECLAQHKMEAGQSWTAVILGDISFSEANNASRSCDTLKLAEQLGPVPGAYKTEAQ